MSYSEGQLLSISAPVLYLQPCFSQSPPSLKPLLYQSRRQDPEVSFSRKQGPGPHCPILAQSCVLVCNMSMAVTSQDCCQMSNVFRKLPAHWEGWVIGTLLLLDFILSLTPSALGCGPDNHPGKAEFPLLQASSIKALARAWWLDQLFKMNQLTSG